jgi:hypothetical protein
MKNTNDPTLKIFIKVQWFNEIASGRKKIEYREYSQFWISRLYDKEGKKRKYNLIEFINGFKTNAPRMITEFKGFDLKGEEFHIYIGKILSRTN